MMVEENEFFRNATLRICGNLEIEEGLRACFEYISQHLPADRIYLEKHEYELGAMRVIVRADAKRGERMDRLVPYTEEAKMAMAEAGKLYQEDQLPPVLVINKSQEEPVTRCLLSALGEPPSSAMSLPLMVEGRIVGALALLAEGDDRFNEEHARLYATLKETFFVAMSNTLKHREVVRLKNRLADDNRFLNRELLRISGDEIVGADFGLKDVMQQVRQVAPTESPVLLTGETGAGKDVISNAIHLGSPRREGPFIPVNCGAIPDSLLDSELFGHEKGAFTGALSRKRGRFERANGGTILLDEIGEMPLDAQVRLLRVLQHREIERLGGTDRIPVDIRIIAATNKNLGGMVEEGRFREDLWFRLNVFPIAVPSLRERSHDIPALVEFFLERKAAELKVGDTPRLAPGAMDVLMAYQWPGNVRELENVIERAMILHQNEPLQFDDLGTSLSGAGSLGKAILGQPSLNLDEVTAHHIRRVLGMAGGKIHGAGGAGELLGINPNTLRYKMKKLGIPFRKDL
ncbi:MAG: sigma 54-interacting transcriptional regulator [Gemmatimonadetes bacterium]|nr:sigma 54-interacting transcriptional regulator [Gemmatimonadota bacterium]NNM07356.1 sigma 54-interacting transcriptional regulator [Gemmatimonadota bacterium]